MYDKFCKGLYLLAVKIIFPVILVVCLLGISIGVPIAMLIDIVGMSLMEAVICTVIGWGVILILIMLSEAITHGEQLVKEEEKKRSHTNEWRKT